MSLSPGNRVLPKLREMLGNVDDVTGWQRDHLLTVGNARSRGGDYCAAGCIIRMLEALASYADIHHRAYNSPIGQDGFIAGPWCEALAAVRAMLNCETNRLDCGTVDAAILAMLEPAGFQAGDPDARNAGLEP